MSGCHIAHNILLGRLDGDPRTWGRQARVAVLSEVEGLRGWLDAREAAVLAASFAECDDVNSGARDLIQLVQQQSGVCFGTAKRRATRACQLPDLPAAAAALEAATIGSGQVDELCALAERLPAELRPELRAAEAALVLELAELTPVQARKRLLEWEADVTPHVDAEAKLDQQRTANRLRFAKNSDGTVNLFGQLDPISAAYLRTAIDRKVTELWRQETPNHDHTDAPLDVMSNERRRAEALIGLIHDAQTGGSGGAGFAEILVLIDYKTLLGDLNAAGVTCHLADGTPIPAVRFAHFSSFGYAETSLSEPDAGSKGADVRRGARTATKPQRSAARAVHHTCCIAGCDLAFEYCQLHHIHWWLHGGPTNLNNLIPVCNKHHRLIHDHKWDLKVDSNRVGTLHRAHQGPDPPSSFAHPPRPRTNPRAKKEEPSDSKNTEHQRSAETPHQTPTHQPRT